MRAGKRGPAEASRYWGPGRFYALRETVRVRKMQGEQGASAVEFAIIASLLFMVLFGTIQFGIIYNRYQGLQAAAREGARVGSITGTTRDAIVERVQQSVSIINGSDIDSLCASNPPTFGAPGEGCIMVSTRSDPSGNPTARTNGTASPCEEEPSTASEPSLIVEVFYRTKLEIPLWASPELTLSSSGEFRCE